MVEWGSSTFFRDHRMGMNAGGEKGDGDSLPITQQDWTKSYSILYQSICCKDTYAHMYMVSDAFIHMYTYVHICMRICMNNPKFHASSSFSSHSCLVLFVLPHFHDQHFRGCFIRQWYNLPKPQHQNPLLYVCKVQFSVVYPLVNQNSYGKSPLFFNVNQLSMSHVE